MSAPKLSENPPLRGSLYLPGLEPATEETSIFAFTRFILTLTVKRFQKGFLWFFSIFSFCGRLTRELRLFVIRKLLWGRGRLFRPLSHLSLVGITSGVLIIAPALNSPVVSVGGLVSGVDDVFAKPVTAETERAEGFSRSEKIEYVVEPGDSLSSIGETFKVSVGSLCATNSLGNCDRLSIGDRLTIPPIEDSIMIKVQKGDTVEKLAGRYEVDPQVIVDANYLFKPFTLEIGQEIIIPGATLPQPEAPQPKAPSVPPSSFASTGEAISGSGRFIWPTSNRTVSQGYHSYHPAIDIPRPKNGPIFAIDSGRIIRAGWWPVGYGYAVQIDHGDGYVSSYCHLSRVAASVGDYVEQGQVVGTMGATGRAFGQHVHFMIQKDGRFLNPLNFYR